MVEASGGGKSHKRRMKLQLKDLFCMRDGFCIPFITYEKGLLAKQSKITPSKILLKRVWMLKISVSYGSRINPREGWTRAEFVCGGC